MYMRLYLHVFYKVATVANKQCKIDFRSTLPFGSLYPLMFLAPRHVSISTIIFVFNGSCCNHQGTVAKLNKVNFI